MKSKVSKKSRRRLFMICVLMIGCIGILASSVLKDWLKILDNKKQSVVLQEKYTALLKEEKELQAEVTKLQDPEYMARYARETFYYSLPDEVIIKMK